MSTQEDGAACRVKYWRQITSNPSQGDHFHNIFSHDKEEAEDKVAPTQ